MHPNFCGFSIQMSDLKFLRNSDLVQFNVTCRTTCRTHICGKSIEHHDKESMKRNENIIKMF